MKKILFSLLITTLCSSPLLASPQNNQSDCQGTDTAELLCGFPAPEDIEVIPGGNYLLLSSFGGLFGEHPQPFRLLNTTTGKVTTITYQNEEQPIRWDNNQCPSPPAAELGSHGIHISQRQDQSWQLLAVNHHRESVEFYQIYSDGTAPQLAWRGCIVLPEGSNLNDVAAIPSGGFLVTHMMDREPGMDINTAMMTKGDTGYLWRWRPEQGLDKLPGSESGIPNGVAVSTDGKSVFIAETGTGQVKKVDYHSGENLGTVPMIAADNFSWTPDGQLLITGINGPLPENCLTAQGQCLAPFEVKTIDPDTLNYSVLWQQNGPPMGAGTVAVEYDGYLYMGSWKGFQLMRVPLGNLNTTP